MTMGSTQPLTEMNIKCISWGEGGRSVRLTTLPPSGAVIMKSGNFNFLETSGPLQACNETALPLHDSLCVGGRIILKTINNKKISRRIHTL